MPNPLEIFNRESTENIFLNQEVVVYRHTLELVRDICTNDAAHNPNPSPASAILRVLAISEKQIADFTEGLRVRGIVRHQHRTKIGAYIWG